MTYNECNEFLDSLIIFGKELIQHGAEIQRVEDTLSRICNAYDFEKTEIYATVGLIVVTIKAPNGITLTQSGRINNSANDLGVIEKLNHLSRKICTTKPPVKDLKNMINEILDTELNMNYITLGNILAGSSFTLFFGGTLLDGLICAVIVLLVFIIDKFFRVSNENKLIYTLIMSAISGFLAILFTYIGLGNNLDKIIIGVVMVFVPTLAIVNGIKDIFYRDIVSGVYRIIEATFIATSMAVGFGIPLFMLRGII